MHFSDFLHKNFAENFLDTLVFYNILKVYCKKIVVPCTY